jgi:hypothetical protein
LTGLDWRFVLAERLELAVVQRAGLNSSDPYARGYRFTREFWIMGADVLAWTAAGESAVSLRCVFERATKERSMNGGLGVPSEDLDAA